MLACIAESIARYYLDTAKDNGITVMEIIRLRMHEDENKGVEKNEDNYSHGKGKS